MSVTLLALGSFFHIQQKDPELAKSIGWLPITSLTIYIIAFALGFGPIPWLLVAELYSKEVQSVMSSITGELEIRV
jgi:facilitated trehalose transporter